MDKMMKFCMDSTDLNLSLSVSGFNWLFAGIKIVLCLFCLMINVFQMEDFSLSPAWILYFFYWNTVQRINSCLSKIQTYLFNWFKLCTAHLIHKNNYIIHNNNIHLMLPSCNLLIQSWILMMVLLCNILVMILLCKILVMILLWKIPVMILYNLHMVQVCYLISSNLLLISINWIQLYVTSWIFKKFCFGWN